MAVSVSIEDFLEDLEVLVRCESPTEDLEALSQVFNSAHHITDRKLGKIAQSELSIHEGRPLLWWGSKTPEILLLAHLDTVWPIGSFEPVWQVNADTIKAPGIFDMKSGFLQAVYSVAALSEKFSAEQIRDSVAIVATSDEETGSFSTRELIKQLSSHAKAVLVLESALDGKVKIARKGTAMYSVTVHGKAAHAGLEPEKGINASVELAHLIIAIEKLSNPFTNTTVVPTVISGGSTTNTVPAMARVEIDARSFLTEELQRVDQEIRKLSTQHPEASIEILGGINRPPLEKSSSNFLFETLKRSASTRNLPEVFGVEVGGASDGNFAAQAGAHVIDGIGAVGGGAHAENEHILISEIQPRITLTTAFLEDLISLLPEITRLTDSNMKEKSNG